VTRATTKAAGPEPSKGSRSGLDIDSPNFRRLAYSPTCLEGECSEGGMQDAAYPRSLATLWPA